MDKEKIIVCLTGMPGAGKSTIAEGLKEHGHDIVNMGDAIREEAKRRNIDPTRSNLAKIMLDIREKNGAGAVAELVAPKIDTSTSRVIIIDGIRSNDEIRSLKRFGTVKTLAIHASIDTRLVFLQRRGRSDDPQTKDHFEERDNRELSVGISDAIALSDHAISNANMTKEELVESALAVICNWVKDATTTTTR